MKSIRILLSSVCLLGLAVPALAYTHARRGPTSPNLFKKRSSKSVVHSSGHASGPRAMDSERATQIQSALIKNGYLSGTPSGHWDAESQSAMQRLQGAQGWQTKLTPDSRALIMLGLGPNTTQPGTASEFRGQEPTLSSNSHLESTFVSQ